MRFLAAGQGPMEASLRQTHRDYGLGDISSSSDTGAMSDD